MTWRSVIIGLATAALIAGTAFYFEVTAPPGAGGFLIPHLMPPIIFGTLLLAVFALNPVLNRLRKGLAFSGKELAVIVSLTLVAASVPSFGVLGVWSTAVMLPHHYNRVTPSWSESGIVDRVPAKMLADKTDSDGKAMNGFWAGLAKSDEQISVAQVPWSAWTRTAAFWIPLMVSIAIAMLALGVVLHRQWSRNEHLSYPIMTFASSVLPEKPTEWPKVFHQRGFWIATVSVLAIAINNYCHKSWPDVLIPITLQFDFTPLAQFFPSLARGAMPVFYPRVEFLVIGLAFFFTTEISFSMWVGPVAFGAIFGYLSALGLSVTTSFGLYQNTNVYIYLGGYVGLLLTMIYTGRHYYLKTVSASLGLYKGDDLDKVSARYLRVFMVGISCFLVQLLFAGLDWFLVLPYTLMIVMIYVVVSRVVAETGAFFIGTWIMPGALLVGLLGPRTVGTQAAAMMGMISVALVAGPGWAPLTFAAQGFKLADNAGVKVGRLCNWMILTLVLSVAIALPAMLYWQYSKGASSTAGGWREYTAKMPFEMAMQVDQRLKAQGVSGVGSFGERLTSINTNWVFASAFGITVLLVIAFAAARMRLRWWPLHPIIFFFVNSTQWYVFSFFVAWLIKIAVMKYGGSKLYNQCKPVMLGLIAGDILGRLVPVVIGILHQVITGQPAAHF